MLNKEQALLLDEAIQIKRAAEVGKRRLQEIDAELETTGLQELQDKKIKQTVLYGETGNKIAITLAAKTEVLNRDLLADVLTPSVMGDSMTLKEVAPSYTLKEPFKRFLTAVRTKDYIKDKTMEEFLKEVFKQIESGDVAFLMKKLKGSYEQDRKWIVAKLGEGDWDVELYHIAQIKNWELICSYMGKTPSDAELDDVAMAVMVEETLKIEYDYTGKK